MHKNSRTLLALLLVSALTLLACQTTDLISGVLDKNTSTSTTRSNNNSTTNNDNSGGNDADQTEPGGSIPSDPDDEYSFDVIGTPRCTVGDNGASIVTGSVVDKGTPVMDVQIQASSTDGGDAANTQPAYTDGNGNFELVLVCGGSGCNGSYWVWMVDNENLQISPSVQFQFDDQCRRGSVNFENP